MATVHTLEPSVVSITAGTAAVQLCTTTAGVRVTSFLVQNQSTATVYLGGSGVTAAAGSGLQIAASTSVTMDKYSLRQEGQTYDPSNYYLVTAATGAVCVLFYNSVLTRS